MTSPIDEEDVEGPLRLQPVVARPQGWRGRSVNLLALGLVGFVVVGIVLGTAFDGSVPSGSPAVAVASIAPVSSPTPTRRPAPTREPLPTPLPTLEINGAIPTERRLVWGNGQQILDLGTGTLRSFGRQFEDMVWQVDGELRCACLVWPRGGTDTAGPVLRFARFDLTGQLIEERDLVTLGDVVGVPEMTEGFNVTATVDPASGHLFVLDVLRQPPVWNVELHVIDGETGTLLDSRIIDKVPVDLEEPRPSASPRTDGGPPDGVYAWAAMIVAAPGGASVFMGVSQSEVRGDAWTSRHLEWIVPIRDGKAGDPSPLPSTSSLATERWCIGRPTFIDADLFVQVCGPPPQPTQSWFWSIRRVTTAGDSLGDVPIGAAQVDGSYAAASLVDRARRAVYLWDPFRHLVSRVDVDDGRVREGAVAESMLPGDRQPFGRGWIGVDPALVASPDGTRLYALGLGSNSGPAATSTGVWVFDAETLDLLDHWEPRALLTSLGVSAGGRFVYAIGAAGHDVTGAENPAWRASVTVYNALTGEIDVLYGAVGSGEWLSFPTLP